LKLNTEEEPDIAGKFKIIGIPTIVVTNKGKEVDRLVGFMPRHMLKTALESSLSKIAK